MQFCCQVIAQSTSDVFNPELRASVGNKTVSGCNSAEFLLGISLQSSGVITPRSSDGLPLRVAALSILIHLVAAHQDAQVGSRGASSKTTFDFPAGQGDGRDLARPSSPSAQREANKLLRQPADAPASRFQ